MDWQPIETAPKDGTIILATGVAHGQRYHDILKWCDEWCCFHPEDNCYSYPVLPPTHWMPLPAAPE